MIELGYALDLGPSLKTVINVELSVLGPMFPSFLSSGGKTRDARLPNDSEGMRQYWKGVQPRLMRRDWRKIRERLIDLDLQKKEEVVVWLEDAGYVPKILATAKWNPRDVSVEIADWLRYRRDVLALLLRLDRDDFRRLIGLVEEYVNDLTRTLEDVFKQDAEDPDQIAEGFPHTQTDLRFKRRLGALKSVDSDDLKKVDLDILVEFTNQYRDLRASFFWNRDGDAFVGVSAKDPMEALIISTHIDRNFSVRRLIDCKNQNSKTCKKKRFEQGRRSGRFCSAKCRTYYKTNMRREKIRQIRSFNIAWKKLPREKKIRQKRLEWIRRRAERALRVQYSEEENKKLLKIPLQWPALIKLVR
ncbi:MAG TPA: hypothetical protein VK763_05765 [Terriglobales bacterium]|jgi:hypothetical protein|nr:hypothetical protein [Terriglobales bacterium]